MESKIYIVFKIVSIIIELTLLAALVLRKISNKPYGKVGVALAICRLVNQCFELFVFGIFMILLTAFISAFGT